MTQRHLQFRILIKNSAPVSIQKSHLWFTSPFDRKPFKQNHDYFWVIELEQTPPQMTCTLQRNRKHLSCFYTLVIDHLFGLCKDTKKIPMWWLNINYVCNKVHATKDHKIYQPRGNRSGNFEPVHCLYEDCTRMRQQYLKEKL